MKFDEGDDNMALAQGFPVGCVDLRSMVAPGGEFILADLADDPSVEAIVRPVIRLARRSVPSSYDFDRPHSTHGGRMPAEVPEEAGDVRPAV